MTGTTGRTPRRRRRVSVRGVVQGVGFRPHVYALARSLDLAGAVWNTADGVVVEVEGAGPDVSAFCERVAREAPPLALVTGVEVDELPPLGGTSFTIRDSETTAGRTFVSPDVTICDDCLDDLLDAGNRRHRHPFVTCTSCGPRFTITTGLPYDRPTTTMAGFPLCTACAREYADPADRRFHAQTVCCPDCGPRLFLTRPGRGTTYDEAALAEARRLIADGAVVAVKGVGGYHLVCDATSEQATSTLRKRKQRGDKAFALLVRTLEDAERLVHLDDAERALLASRARPVVLAGRRSGAPVADAVAPGSADLGVMLPATPLHHLLLGLPGDPGGPVALVMTSGNLSGEPIVTGDEEARTRLAAVADAWLGHDRPIHVPCDDSVSRVVDGEESPVRRSRGHAPLPLDLPFDAPATLAVGGDLKNTFCLAEGRLAWLSGHVGDMDDISTLDSFDRAVSHLGTITGVVPVALAVDRHPAYRSRQWAARHADGRPVLEVQHHHAHVASTMAEHGVPPGVRVLGVAFDGTGYGDDGAAWGGEFLVADYTSSARAAHLSYVPLPGGDAGVRNPCRMALSHLRSAGLDWDDRLPSVRVCGDDELALLDRQLTTGLRCVPTSSMGRLFDAVASIAGIRHRVGYDAQAAMELEAVARGASGSPGYQFGLVGTGPDGHRIDAAPVVTAAAADVLARVPASVVAARFQQGVVDLVVAVLTRLRDETGLTRATLSGGVFLNATLTGGCARALATEGFEVLRHRRVPASDAGLALGQVAVLAHRGRPSDPSMSSKGRRGEPPEEETPCA
ncbi:carbamoyltransferase HypF [Nocardioides sp. MAHUQ-72]|uniref:carbamoyltransferase HypF n=1 Tax=unclassified Nocardioides TaxID=2615069 RepID=UPI003610B4BA